MFRGDACVSLDLLTRLSPEDVDERMTFTMLLLSEGGEGGGYLGA